MRNCRNSAPIFSPAAWWTAVFNMGMPAPIDIQVSGSSLRKSYAMASRALPRKCVSLPGVSDVLIPQDIDYPALQLDIDREKASLVGLSQKEVVDNVITALTSNGMIAPNYWIDPKSGNPYMLTVQYPEDAVKTIEDLKQIPLRGAKSKEPTTLDTVVTREHDSYADRGRSLPVVPSDRCVCVAEDGGLWAERRGADREDC